MKTNKIIVALLVFLFGMVAIAAETAAAPAFNSSGTSPEVVRAPDEKAAAAAGRPPAASTTQPSPSLVPGRSGGVKSDSRVSFTVYGTWNALQAITTIIGQYEDGRQSHGIHFMPIDSEQIMGLLGRHQCDVAMPFDSFVPKTNDKTVSQCESFPLGRFVIAVAVNAISPLRAMSMSDLQKIFAMNLMTGPGSWRDISGSGSTMRIELYRPDKFGPEGWFFQKRILFGGPFADEFSRESIAQHQKKSDAEIIAAIAKQANAIGFFRCPFDKIKEKRIRILGIAKDNDNTPVLPSPATLAGGVGDYPLADTLTIYLRPDAPAEAKEFYKFASGPKGAKIVRQCGFWPEYELKEVRAKQHLIAAKRGKGEMIAVHDLTASGRLLKDLGREFVKAKTAAQLSVDGDGDAEEQAMVLTPEEAKQELRVNGSDLLLAVRAATRSEQQKAEGDERRAARIPTLAKRPKSTAGTVGQSSPESLAPRTIVLGQMAVGIIVHPKNMLDALPLNELRDIFSGEVAQWPGAGGAAGAMRVYGPHATDPVAQLLKERIENATGAPLKYHALTDNQKVILEVARDHAAIGFVDLSQLSPKEKSVKLLDVYLPGRPRAAKTSEKDAKGPTDAKAEGAGRKVEKPAGKGQPAAGRKPATAKPRSPVPAPALPAPRLSSLAAYSLPEDYPLVRTFTLYISPNASQTAKDFAQFVASDHCGQTLLKHNLLPPMYAGGDRGAAAPEKPQKPHLGPRR